MSEIQQTGAGNNHTSVTNYLEWSDKGRSAIWRYLVVIVLGFICWQFGSIPVIKLFPGMVEDPMIKSAVFQYTFIIGLIGIFLLVRLFLSRPAYSVMVPSWPPRPLPDYGLGILIQWILLAVTLVALPFNEITYRGWGAEMNAGVLWILATIIGFMIQTGFEEIYFRGLVAQATRKVTKLLPFVIGIQALWFAQLHGSNIEGWGGGYMAMAPYFVTAITWGWVAWRTGSLLLSMGLHVGNNTFLVLFVNSRGDVIQSGAPFVLENLTLPHTIIAGIIHAVLTIIIVEFVMRRRERKAGSPA